jgi:hypothetical protein
VASGGIILYGSSPGVSVAVGGSPGEVEVTFPSCPPGQVPILLGSTTSGEAIMISGIIISGPTTTITVKTNDNSTIFFQVICCEGTLPPI